MKSIAKILYITLCLATIWGATFSIMVFLALTLGPNLFWERVIISIPLIFTAMSFSEMLISYYRYKDKDNNSSLT